MKAIENTTIENNKLIAEFMGLKPKCERDGVYSYSETPFYLIIENDIDKVVEGIAKYAKYNSDWNWLMEVVEKIERLSLNEENYSFYVGISTQGTLIMSKTKLGYPSQIVDTQANKTKIQSVYNACPEFVKWYNKQKN